MVLHAVKKAPTVFAHAARNHKVLTTSLALVSTAIAIPQTRRAMSRGINSVLKFCLFNAAQQGYVCMVKILLKSGININQQDSLGFTALYCAAFHGNQAVVELLLAHGAGINIVDNSGRTALHWAAHSGRQAVVELLLAHGAGINQQDAGGWTALHSAASNGHQAVVELLLVHGADPNIANGNGWTALQWAACWGHQAVVELLLARGADPNIANGNGLTALQWAAFNGHQAVVELLLARGADPNVANGNGWTALQWAASNGHQAVVESLLVHGADPNIANGEGLTALQWAAFNGHQAVVELLVLYGADTELRSIHGFTAEDFASGEEIRSCLRSVPRLTADLKSAVERKDVLAVRQLVAQKAPVLTLDQDGNTLVHRVIGSINPNKPSIQDEIIVRILMRAVPHHATRVRNRSGQTLLHAASYCGNPRIVRCLLKYGAELNMRDAQGNVPLYYAIREYNPNEPTVHDEIARTLMRAAPYQGTYARNRYGQTLLHRAAVCGNSRIARYLLRHGGMDSINLQDGQGNTPLHYARTRIMRDLLLENHADPTLMNREGQVPMAVCPHLWYDLIDQRGQQ